jgi:hypothetical protein
MRLPKRLAPDRSARRIIEITHLSAKTPSRFIAEPWLVHLSGQLRLLLSLEVLVTAL